MEHPTPMSDADVWPIFSVSQPRAQQAWAEKVEKRIAALEAKIEKPPKGRPLPMSDPVIDDTIGRIGKSLEEDDDSAEPGWWNDEQVKYVFDALYGGWPVDWTLLGDEPKKAWLALADAIREDSVKGDPPAYIQSIRTEALEEAAKAFEDGEWILEEPTRTNVVNAIRRLAEKGEPNEKPDT